MKIIAKLALLAACAASTAVAMSAPADARPRKRVVYGADTIVVRPRSFTNSGTVVPVGSRSAYIQEMTIHNWQPYERYSPGILWRPDPGFR